MLESIYTVTTYNYMKLTMQTINTHILSRNNLHLQINVPIGYLRF